MMQTNDSCNKHNSNTNNGNHQELHEIKSNLLLEQAMKTQQLHNNYLLNVADLVSQYNTAISQQQTQFQQQTKLIDALLNVNNPNNITAQQLFITPNRFISALPTNINNINNTNGNSQYPLQSLFPQLTNKTLTIPNQYNNNPNLSILPPKLIIDSCNNNNFEFEMNKKIKIETKANLQNDSFQCIGCNKKFLENKDLLKHLNSIDHKKPHKCNKCCKSFSRLGNLNNHSRIHENEGINNNANNTNTNANTNNTRNDKNKNIIMSKSNRIKLDNFNNNIQKPFKCDECDKSFRNKSGLSNHRIIHNGQKPHKCTFAGCGKAFARSCDLTRHIRLHTGDKPFKCKYKSCNKSFTRSVQLRLHLMDHTGQRPFKCDICKKKFKTLQNAQIHLRIHTGEKPYVCDYCKKRFTQSSSLKTHLSSIHSDAQAPQTAHTN